MTMVATTTQETVHTPRDFRERLHSALDVLLAADERLTAEQARQADEAFCTLVRIARASGGAK
jgi:hypothetical protein